MSRSSVLRPRDAFRKRMSPVFRLALCNGLTLRSTALRIFLSLGPMAIAGGGDSFGLGDGDDMDSLTIASMRRSILVVPKMYAAKVAVD